LRRHTLPMKRTWRGFSVVGCLLSVVGCRLSVVGCQCLVVGSCGQDARATVWGGLNVRAACGIGFIEKRDEADFLGGDTCREESGARPLGIDEYGIREGGFLAPVFPVFRRSWFPRAAGVRVGEVFVFDQALLVWAGVDLAENGGVAVGFRPAEDVAGGVAEGEDGFVWGGLREILFEIAQAVVLEPLVAAENAVPWECVFVEAGEDLEGQMGAVGCPDGGIRQAGVPPLEHGTIGHQIAHDPPRAVPDVGQ
jgi:hypothetical protein